jgi:hypothetical protein
VLPENDQFRKNPMLGEHYSEYLEFEEGRSWTTWAGDLEKGLKQSLPIDED